MICNLKSPTTVCAAAGDHLVGWANSSIRHPDELPEIDSAMQRKGVIREEPLQAGMHSAAAASFLQYHASDGASSSTTTVSFVEDKQQANSRQADSDKEDLTQAEDPDIEEGVQSAAQLQSDHTTSTSSQAEQGHDYTHEQEAAEQAVGSSQNALLILRRLQILPWRRIDVSFEATNMPYFAHNHIQVTRKWLNWYGNAVCQHLAQQLADMEKDASVQGLIGV